VEKPQTTKHRASERLREAHGEEKVFWGNQVEPLRVDYLRVKGQRTHWEGWILHLGHAACKKVNKGASLMNQSSFSSSELKTLEILLKSLVRGSLSTKGLRQKNVLIHFLLLQRQSESWRITMGRHPRANIL
jgi:hypothetical protein